MTNIRRGVWLAFGLATLSACGQREAPPPEIVARVGDWTLAVDEMAELLVLAQPFPLEAEQVAPMVRHWVEMAAFTRRTAEGTEALVDRNLVLESRWNEVREEVLAQFRSRQFADHARIPSEAIDSVYGGDEIRAVAHVLRRAGPEATEEMRIEQLARARGIRDQIVGGAPWSVANEANQDVESRQRGGLMIVRRGQGSPQINEVAFDLRPGELSPVFSSPEGFHLLVRPRLSEVRNAFAGILAEEALAAAEAEFAQALSEEKGLMLTPGAADLVRRVASDPFAEVDNSNVVAEFEGGVLSAGQAARFLHFLPSEIRPELIDGPDWGVEDFARQLAFMELLWAHVESLGYELDDVGYQNVVSGYGEELDLIWEALEIDPADFADDRGTPAELEAAARMKLDIYFEYVTARTKTLHTVPPFLALALLADVEWEIDPEGLEAAMATAQRLLELAGYEEVG
jgi:hypothetical protein